MFSKSFVIAILALLGRYQGAVLARVGTVWGPKMVAFFFFQNWSANCPRFGHLLDPFWFHFWGDFWNNRLKMVNQVFRKCQLFGRRQCPTNRKKERKCDKFWNLLPQAFRGPAVAKTENKREG